MELKTALAFALISGRNACAITDNDFSKRSGISLERLQAIEHDDVEMTPDETYSISKVICKRKPIFWQITRYFLYTEISDTDVIENFRKEILELPVNRISELMSVFDSYVPEGFGKECGGLLEMSLVLLFLYHEGKKP